jgi:hypothetical protein
MNKCFSIFLLIAVLALCSHSANAYTCLQNYVQLPLQTIDITDPNAVTVNQTAGSLSNGCYGSGCSINQVYYCGSPSVAQSTGTIAVNLYLPKVDADHRAPNNSFLIELKNNEIELYISNTFLTSKKLPGAIEVDQHLDSLFDELADLMGIDSSSKKRSNGNLLRLQPPSPVSTKSALRAPFVCGWNADYTVHEITVKNIISGVAYQWEARNPEYCWWGGCSIVKQALQDIPSDTWCSW